MLPLSSTMKQLIDTGISDENIGFFLKLDWGKMVRTSSQNQTSSAPSPSPNLDLETHQRREGCRDMYSQAQLEHLRSCPSPPFIPLEVLNLPQEVCSLEEQKMQPCYGWQIPKKKPGSG